MEDNNLQYGMIIPDINQESDMGRFHQNKQTWNYARNAITHNDKGNVPILGNEPSNFLCAEIRYEYESGPSQPAQIVGLIYLYDDKWAVFSTLNTDPDDNLDSEIGIFDLSQCLYIPVVRDKCLKFSKKHLISGISRLSYRNNYVIYWADGYNPDRFLDLGNYELWPKTLADRGDVTQDPWIDDFLNIPYEVIDTDPGPCVQYEPIKPLKLNCDKLRIAPYIKIPCIRGKKSFTNAGTLSNGIYWVAVAYSVRGNRYSNYFISQPIHVFTDNGLSGSIDVSFSGMKDNEIFEEFEMALVFFTNGQLFARKLGYFDVRLEFFNISNVLPSYETIDPTSVLYNNPVYETSDSISQINDVMVRIKPKFYYDFNYQPLANLIRTEWYSCEYPDDYYRFKNQYTDVYSIDSDVVQYLRDEVYTFYIRWIYDTGYRSPMFHIPSRPRVELELCDEYIQEQKNDAIYIGSLTNYPTQDGGDAIAYGYTGTYISNYTYDSLNPERWNWTNFKNNMPVSMQGAYLLPYPATTDADYDLCGKNIRLHRMPDEQTHSSLKLYNPANKKIRLLGVRFSNIYHPLDDKYNRIPNIVGFEIYRALRDGNKTIIAKGVVKTTRGYNYIEEKNSNNPANHNALFPSFPFDDDTNTHHPYLSMQLSKIIASFNNQYFAQVNLSARDTWESIPVTRYNNVGNINEKFITFHGPDTQYARPYANWLYLKQYGEVFTDKVINRYVINKNISQHKILSPTVYAQTYLRSIGKTISRLNGTIRISIGGSSVKINATSAPDPETGVGTMATIMQYIGAGVGVYGALLSNMVMNNVSSGIGVSALNAFGYALEDIGNTISNAANSIAGISAMMGGGELRTPVIEKLNDGILSVLPKTARAVVFVPLFLQTFNDTFYDNITPVKALSPYLHYSITNMADAYYTHFETYTDKCRLNIISDSYYIKHGIYNVRDKSVINGKIYSVNNLYRVNSVILNLQTPLGGRIKKDNSLSNLISDNCCYCEASNGFKEIIGSSADEIPSCVFNTRSALKYVSLKVPNNQAYGDLNNTKKIRIGCPIQINPGNTTGRYSTDVLFDGDTYVTPYSEKDSYLYFLDYPLAEIPGIHWDFNKYRNVLYPRFWLNTQDNIDSQTILMDYFNKLIQRNKQLCNVTPGKCGDTLNFEANVLLLNSFGIGTDEICVNQLSMLCEIDNAISGVIGNIGGVATYISNVNLPSFSQPPLNCNFNLNIPILQQIAVVLCYLLQFLIIIVALLLYVIALLLVFVLLLATIIVLATVSLAISGLLASITLCVIATSLDITSAQSMLSNFIKYNLDYCNIGTCLPRNFNCPQTYIRKKITNVYGAVPTILSSYVMNTHWLYLSQSSVKTFWVESEYNNFFRLPKEGWPDPYDIYGNTDLFYHFEDRKLKNQDYFIYDSSMNYQYASHMFATMDGLQPRDYNTRDARYAYTYDRTMLIYSLPQHRESKRDNWRIYLPLNYKKFDDIITGVYPIRDTGALVLFECSSPIWFSGSDTLTTSNNVNINLGTGNLFNQPARSASNVDSEYQYGSCQDPKGVVNTPDGIFFMGNKNGKIFAYSGSLIEISASGMKYWSSYYLPFELLNDIPDFPYVGNTILGIGDTTVYDTRSGMVYFSKKDYAFRKIHKDQGKTVKFFKETTIGSTVYKDVFIIYDSSNNIESIVSLSNLSSSHYFEDVSFTLSYSAGKQAGGFISFHDWHPEFAEGSNLTFFTTKGNGIWKHNSFCDSRSYCSFYGQPYNFEVDLIMDNNNLQVDILRNVEYYLECYIYKENCINEFHDLEYNFNYMVVYNTEQISGLLRLIPASKNNPYDRLDYPKITIPNVLDVLYEKSEQKYRVNMFWDMTRDRGEFTTNTFNLINYYPNGYIREVNPLAVDYFKNVTERKKFRHYTHSVWLIRTPENNQPIDRKMFVNIINLKKAVSIR